MATSNSSDSSSDKSTGRSRGGRAMKTAAVMAAVGLATLAVAKGLKTRRGRALKKKALTKGRKVVRQVKSAARSGSKRGTRKSASRAR